MTRYTKYTQVKDYMCSLHTDPKGAFVEQQGCSTLVAYSFYQLAGPRMVMLMTHREPQTLMGHTTGI